MRARMIWSGVMLLALILTVGIFFWGYQYLQCKPCVQVEIQKKDVVKKPVLKVPVKKTQIVAAPQLILRLNVVEWSKAFEGKSLMSRDIGPIIRKGLAEGTVKRTAIPLTFKVDGREVPVHNGQAILYPGPIGPETAMVVAPSEGVKFASPPPSPIDGSPMALVTGPGELDSLAKRGVEEVWLNFILAPR